jgi:hypothetical protein
MSVFVTDKRIETLNYDLVCTRKDLKEMTVLVQTNSTTIADLLGLIRQQNKWLTELRLEVESLKSELSVLKKGNCVVEKVDQSEVSVESKSTVEEEIKPEDKPFRHFEFDKSWEELPAVKEWGDSEVVYGIYFNLVRNCVQTCGARVIHPQQINNYKCAIDDAGLLGSKFIEFEISISVKDAILTLQKFFQEPIDKSYINLYRELNASSFYPCSYLTFPEFLQRRTVKGYFLCCNKIQSIKLDPRNSVLCINIYS